METTENTTRQRKKELQDDVEDELSNNTEKNEKKEKPKKELKKGFQYYYNRFRYYHYYIANKIETCLGVICLWILKIQFYLMGYRLNGVPSVQEIETDN